MGLDYHVNAGLLKWLIRTQKKCICLTKKLLIKILEYPISSDAFTSLLNNGQCLILLDGLDEINSEFLYEFDKQITKFGTRFNKNYIIISSRPYQNNAYLNTFKNLNLQPFTKFQAKTLIGKLNYKPETPEIAEEFIIALDKKLYDKNKEFCENPLLLTFYILVWSIGDGGMLMVLTITVHLLICFSFLSFSVFWNSVVRCKPLKSSCLLGILTPFHYSVILFIPDIMLCSKIYFI